MAGAVALIVTTAVSPAAHALNTRIWTGGSGGAYSTAANWGAGGAPGVGDIAQFSSSTNPCTITAPVTVSQVNISVGVTLTVASGQAVAVTGDWNQSAGTVAGGTTLLVVGGNFNLSGGTFTSTSGRFKVTGAYNQTNGSFVHNSGQLMLNSYTPQTFTTKGTTFNEVIITDGLVGYWKFDDTATSAADSSGYSRTATWGGSTTSSNTIPTTGINFTNPHSISIPGSNSYASFAPPTLDDMTIAAWVKSTSTGDSTYPRIVDMDCASLSFSRANSAGEHPDSVSWTVNFNDGTNSSWRTPTLGISDGTWYHVVATFDGTSAATIYINGVLQPLTVWATGNSGSSTNKDCTGTGYIGNKSTLDRDWNGLMDEMRMYDRVLSAADVRDLYSGSPRVTSIATQTLAGALITADDLSIVSGTLDASAAGCSGASCGVTVAGNWYNYGGIFTPRTGTVTFNGTASTNVILSQWNPFYNLTVSNTGTWTLQDRLFVDGTLTMSAAGTLAQSSSNYDIHAGTLNKTAGTISGSGDVVLDAATAQSLTVNSMAPNLRVESPLDNGLLGYWKLDEGRGPTAYDVSGNGNSGTLTSSPIWSTSVPTSPAIPIDDAGSLSFNGTSQYVSLGNPAALNFAGQVTLAAWVNVAAIDGTRNILAHGYDASTEVYLRINNSSYEIGSWNGPTYAASYAVPGSDIGNWVHLVGVYDGTTWRLYRNGSEVDSTVSATGALTVASNWAIGARGDGTSRWFSGKIDDVRIYNRGLSANEVVALYNYGYTTGSTVVYSLGGTSAVSGTLKIDSGILDGNGNQNSITGASAINGGTYRISTNTNGQTFTGGLQIDRCGNLTLAGTNGKAILGNGSTLVMNGTLTASNTAASIQAVSSGRYTFNIGTTSTATPTLNITGLQVKDTTANGMYINTDTSSVTTFTNFNNIAFSNGNGTGVGNYNLRIYATLLNLTSTGCTFDYGGNATVEKNVYLVGNGTGDGDTRANFGAACASNKTDCEAYDGDDDASNPPDGTGDNAGNAAVIQWMQAAYADTSGSIEGFPTTAFDWNNFSYYSTYVAYHDTSGTVDTIYVRNAGGAAVSSWNTASGENIIGTPRWDSTGAAGSRVHHLYVATTGGKVYHLIDTNGTLAADTATPWDGANNPYNCSCTITTPLAQDTSNLYFGGISGQDKLWSLSKTSASPRLVGTNPLATSATTNNTAPAVWIPGSTYAFLGLAGRISQVNISTQAVAADNTNPTGVVPVTGRITIIFNKVYAGDDGGYLWSLDPTSFAGTAKFWGYRNHASAVKSHYFDPLNARVYFGDQDGHLMVVNSSGAAVTGFPWSTGSGAYATAPFYQSGVVVMGTTTGSLYFIDQNYNGSSPQKIQTYEFGSNTAISGIAYDQVTSRYLVSTANATNKDGKLYYFALVADPTTNFP